MASAASSCPMVLVLDVILFAFFLVLIVCAPLLDAQAALPFTLFPDPLLRVASWYKDRFGDYLASERPFFFVGLVWHELFFIWPLAIANAYAMLARRSWFNTTCLILGSSLLTSMAAILGELVLSGKASESLLKLYVPFAGFALLAFARGLMPCGCTSNPPATSTNARKKRA
ncbi:Transmembrane protein [Nymphaea thermarum]|nr:Transmembrane protein [Nymphaea thermarum]